MGCQLGKMYQRNSLMCANIAKNLVNGYLKESFYECCNITRPTTDSESQSNQNGSNRTCPTGYVHNIQGLFDKGFNIIIIA